MRFVHLVQESGVPDAQTVRAWNAEYKAGRRIGIIRLGRQHIFFRKGLTVYAAPYAQISRYFRRVLTVPARIGCCAGGELHIEHLVLCGGASGGRELAQIQVPGERAARILMDELRRLAPDAASGCPKPAEAQSDAPSKTADAVQLDTASDAIGRGDAP